MIAAIVLDEAGHLWVRPFSLREDESSEWSVFDPRGRFAGTVALPRQLEPTRIGEDFVLGIWRDEMEIETVRLFALMRGP